MNANPETNARQTRIRVHLRSFAATLQMLSFRVVRVFRGYLFRCRSTENNHEIHEPHESWIMEIVHKAVVLDLFGCG
jgi:hypothetical protein